MTRRRGFLIGFGMVAVVMTAVIGWQVYEMRDPCMTGRGDGGSCPTLADVNGVRYMVGGSQELVNIEGHLTAYDTIAQTNASSHFTEPTVYALTGIDPSVALVGMSTQLVGDARGPHRLLLAVDRYPEAWPAICRYLPNADADDRCA